MASVFDTFNGLNTHKMFLITCILFLFQFYSSLLYADTTYVDVFKCLEFGDENIFVESSPIFFYNAGQCFLLSAECKGCDFHVCFDRQKNDEVM